MHQRLDERLRLLSGGWRTGVGRHQTLQATVDWSFALLTPAEQAVFDRLGVFVGSFTIDDAIAVAGNDGVDELDVVDAVSGLVDKSMCTVDTTGPTTRYRYLETMRAYARAHLERDGTLNVYSTRHSNHFAERGILAVRSLTGPDEVAIAEEVELITADLRAAFLWAADHDLAEALGYLSVLSSLMMLRGSSEMARWFHDARDQLETYSAARAADMVYVFLALGDMAETRRLAEQLVEGRRTADAGRSVGDARLGARHGGQLRRGHLMSGALLRAF